MPTTQPADALATIVRAPSTRPAPRGPVGQPIDRVDGRLKVTGAAKYAAEASVKNAAHAVCVGATIGNGRVVAIDDAAARAMPGVLLVLTPANMPTLTDPSKGASGMAASLILETRPPLSDQRVVHALQHVAVVVADTLARARAAADAIKVTYAPDRAVVALDDPRATEKTPAQNMGEPLQVTRGDVAKAIARGDVASVAQAYATPTETHNPMEMHATTAAWDGDGTLTVWDATQYVMGTQRHLAKVFDLKPDAVRVLCPFVGGGFGCKGGNWGHTVLAAVAARELRRPVRLMLTRQQMFGTVGHRPETRQQLTLAATRSDGRLVAIRHDTTMQGSPIGPFIEPCAMGTSRLLYATPNFSASHAVRLTNVGPGAFMRAPGEASGTFALESAMDEMAAELGMDPLELRVVNHADGNPQTGQAWSSKHLLECYRLGAEKFGWAKRSPAVGTMRADDGRRLGWGVATATYPGYKMPASARIRLLRDGAGELRAVGASAVHDLGTGAYTVATQMTASITGLPIDKVSFLMGDTLLPEGPVAGGSTTTASLAASIGLAAGELKRALLKVVTTPPADGGPAETTLHQALGALAGGVDVDAVELRDGALVLPSGARIPLIDLINMSGKPYVEGVGGFGMSDPSKGPTFHSFGVHFVEVAIDDPVPLIRVRRVVSVMNVGTIVNPKTARSQVVGGVVMGIGMALTEHTVYDPRSGKPVTDNLADYAVATNPDVHQIETYFVDEPDYAFNPIGCRGVGEIGITGVAAAIANAVHHATGIRVRELPITPDKLLGTV